MPTRMNNQFSPRSIPDPNTNSSPVGTNNQVSSTPNLDPNISLAWVIRDQKMIPINNRGQVRGSKDEKRMEAGKTSCEEILDISNNNEDSPSNKSPIRHEDIMDILTNNEALEINPDSPDEVASNERDSITEEDVKVVDIQSVSATSV